MTLKQWVNLPKNNIFKDNEIDSIDRCGEVTVILEVDKEDKAIAYKLRVTADKENIAYKPSEEKRNPDFKMTKGMIGIVDSKKIFVEDVKLPPAGGNKYKIEVEDACGNVVSTSVQVEAYRKLFYQKISMKSKADIVPSYSLKPMEDNALKYFIQLDEKGVEKQIPYFKTVMLQKQNSNSFAFKQAIASEFDIDSELKNRGVAAVFSEYLAKKGKRDFKQKTIIGFKNNKFYWDASRFCLTGDKYLWHGLDDLEDSVKHWFIDGYVSYNNKKTGEFIDYFLKRDQVVILGDKKYTYGGHHRIQINIPPGSKLEDISKKVQGEVEITIEVNFVDGWVNGFSSQFSGIKLITCARKVRWKDMPNITSDYTWIHEIGHRYGMTAYGDKDYSLTNNKFYKQSYLPDAPSSLYGENRGVNDRRHQGPHCSKGAEYDDVTEKWSKAPKCVMFGANGIGKNHSPNDYCDECKPIVRKLDLSN